MGTRLEPLENLGAKVLLTTALLNQFAEGLVNSMGEFAGEKLMSQIFGKGSDLDFKQLLKEIEAIVKIANAKQTIKNQSGEINAVHFEATVFYENEKESNPNNRTSLYNSLEALRSRLNSALHILMEPECQKPGISVFITGAEIMLALVEEMALVDPNHKDYKKTGSYESFKTCIELYSAHVTSTRKEMMTERLAKVSGVRRYQRYSSGYLYCGYEYTDSYTGTRHSFPDGKSQAATKAKAEASHREYVDKLSHKLDWMIDVVSAWENASIKA